MSQNSGRPLIILGASARAAAQSALRAGYQPWCIDLFADRDLRAIASVRRCPPGVYPQAMLNLLHDAPQAPVLLTGAMENHPAVVRAIARRRPLWGLNLEQILALRQPEACSINPATTIRCLLKPRRSAGGRGIRFHQPGQHIDGDHYLQAYIEGSSISGVFLARHGRARLLGASQQIIGDPHFGAHDFMYVGNVHPAACHPALEQAMQPIARQFDLDGLFGVDAVIDSYGRVHPVEINPRYTASVELIERGLGVSVLSLENHLEPLDQCRLGPVMSGKAIAYAKGDCRVGDLYELFQPEEIADVPDPGTKFHRGQPICTVLAFAGDGDALEQLQQRVDRLYTRL